MRRGAGVPPAVARAFCPCPARAGRPSDSGRDGRTTARGQNVHSTVGETPTPQRAAQGACSPSPSFGSLARWRRMWRGSTLPMTPLA